VPADTPVTAPVVPAILAIEGVLLTHVPPVMVLVRVVVDPLHTEVAPESVPAVAEVVMVITLVVNAVPHALDTA
jgi:hypothetical protein